MKAVMDSEGGVRWSHGIVSRRSDRPAACNQPIKARAKLEWGRSVDRWDSKTSCAKGQITVHDRGINERPRRIKLQRNKGVATTGTSTDITSRPQGRPEKKGTKRTRFDAEWRSFNPASNRRVRKLQESNRAKTRQANQAIETIQTARRETKHTINKSQVNKKSITTQPSIYKNFKTKKTRYTNKSQHIKGSELPWITTDTENKKTQRDAHIRDNPERQTTRSNQTEEISRITKQPRMNTKKKNIKCKQHTKKSWPSTLTDPSRYQSGASNKDCAKLKSTRIRRKQQKGPSNQRQKLMKAGKKRRRNR